MLPNDHRAPGSRTPRRRPTGKALLLTMVAVLAAASVVLVGGVTLVGLVTPAGPQPALASTPSVPAVPTPARSSTALIPSAPASTASVRPPSAPILGTAAALLATLPIKGRAPKTGYDRSQFGQEWADTDRNGCDTRNDVLRRDLDDVVLKEGTAGCVVLTGTLVDPFSGKGMPFAKGTTSADIHVDHVVALSDAWQKGAGQWSASRRLAFGNDPLNLLAVDGVLNMAKGDGDAATWLPPAKTYRCAYVARQVAVKAKYGAWVTQAEHDAIGRVLVSCPGELAPTGDAPVEAQVGSAGTTSAQPPAVDTGAEPLAPGCDLAYPDFCIASVGEVGDLDCGDVAGDHFRVLAPDPHGFDGNHDGTGCES